MTKHYAITLILLLAIAGTATGCRTPGKHAKGYSTTPDEPLRNTEQARAKHRAALAHIDSGEHDKAEALLKESLQFDVTFGPAHNSLGLVYFEQDKLYLAAWEFEYAAKLMPNRVEPRNNLGMVLEAVGRLDEAIAEYDRALELEPDNTQVIGNLARTRVRTGDKSEHLSDLLQQLILKDTRNEWRAWAREKLALMGTLIPE